MMLETIFYHYPTLFFPSPAVRPYRKSEKKAKNKEKEEKKEKTHARTQQTRTDRTLSIFHVFFFFFFFFFFFAAAAAAAEALAVGVLFGQAATHNLGKRALRAPLQLLQLGRHIPLQIPVHFARRQVHEVLERPKKKEEKKKRRRTMIRTQGQEDEEV
jgi:hypothetical protein